MDVKLKRKWVKALRSGKYKQGKEYLHNNNKFCCLGVLCVVAGAKIVDDELFLEDKPVIGRYGDQYIRPKFAKKFGVAKKQQKLLSDMNDGDPWNNINPKTFKKIADYIEENL